MGRLIAQLKKILYMHGLAEPDEILIYMMPQQTAQKWDLQHQGADYSWAPIMVIAGLPAE